MRPILALALALIAGSGCWNPFASDRERITLAVSEIDAPAEIGATARLAITLTVVTGGCKRFDRIQADRSANRLTLTVRGWDTPDANCTADIRFEPRPYEAVPPFADPFTIAVRQPDGSELTREVRVR